MNARTSIEPDARMTNDASAAELSQLTRALYARLDANLASACQALGPSERRSNAKRMAVLAVALETRRFVRRPRAIAVAATVVAEAHGLTPGAQRKTASEARALVSYAAQAEMLPIDAPRDDDALLARIDDLFARINTSLALTNRAEQFAGARGGRPARADGDLIAELRRLISRSEAGDRAARAELVAVSRQVQAWVLENIASEADEA